MIYSISAADLTTASPAFGPTTFVRRGSITAKYLPRSNAWMHMYERYYLFDADREPDTRSSSIYMGHCRFGIHKYTAEALIKISTRAPRFYVRTVGYLHGFFRPKQNEAIPRLLRGVRASMAVRDTVLVDTNVTRMIQVRDVNYPDGGHYVGELIEN